MPQSQLIEYYSQRAAEYERIYQKPERQANLQRLRVHLRDLLRGRRVLELACGTGYWTAGIADAAKSVYAIDASEEVLEIARAKGLDGAKVRFARGDAFLPLADEGPFDAGLAGFWWSHVPLAMLGGFLERFHAALLPGARVVFMDNRFVAGSSTPVSRTDGEGNTYQQRRLDSGVTHEVLKNFPDAVELRRILLPYSKKVSIVEFEYFWGASYNLT